MDLLKKRLMELAEKSFRNNQYVFTNFLNMAEMNAFYEIRKEISHVPFTAFGGTENCERLMLRFGSEDLFGYEPNRSIKRSQFSVPPKAVNGI